MNIILHVLKQKKTTYIKRYYYIWGTGGTGGTG